MRKQTNALQLLRSDHREVQKMFQRFERASEGEEEDLVHELVEALTLHTRVEEEVFYPYLREATDRIDVLEEASVEHGAAKQLLAELESGENGVHRHAVVKVLSEYVGHHIREEEETIFPLVEKIGVDLDALGEEILEHKQALQEAPAGRGARSEAKSTQQARGAMRQ